MSEETSQHEGPGEPAEPDGGRVITYCLIPAELAPKLHGALRRHFAGDPSIEVVVERRSRERRSGEERRHVEGEPPAEGERRQILSATGRRAGERRAQLAPVAPPALPRRAARYEEQIFFVRRVEPAGQRAEDLDSARLVMRFQTGDKRAFDTLYSRYFDRVYAYMRVALKNHHDAEDATQQVFMQAFEALPRFEYRKKSLRYWLFIIARNEAVGRLREQQRIELVEPAELDRRRAEEASPEQLDVLGWITDRDLMIFVERLPVPQRQVLVLRYLLDLPAAEIAKLMDREPADVRVLQHRAVRFLEDRLRAIGRVPPKGPRAQMRAAPKQSGVLRLRRFALWG